ncbi:type VI secretion system baseplate subunit TssG [Duganella sp. BuS-21]|uniref:type VI secretion system baseplate subunit TssG n=1 Tax=Duganella sp. BuS-21 TaxID=2943848 RepID=UPI0035A63062
MPTSQRRFDSGLIGTLLNEPHRFEFFQAVRLIEHWRPGSARFRNRLSMGFPPNQLENISSDDSGVRVTPAFMGMLGSQGVLPLHYSERIGLHERNSNDGGPRAFLDIFSHRPLSLFYQAWARNRPDENEGLLNALTALAGAHLTPELIERETLAFYAAQIRSRTVSAPMMAGVYTEYFGVPIEVEQLVGEWQALPAEDQASLGRANVSLQDGVMLGQRLYRCDARARLRIGPLNSETYEQFLPGGDAARKLAAMLDLHCGVGITYEVHLIQRAADMQGTSLDGQHRLGVNARLLSKPATRDRDELMYLLHS